VTAFKDAVFQLLASVDGTEELFEQALDCFLEKLTENATNTRYKEDGRTYVTLSVDNDALSRSLRETRADLVKDRAFCRELRELAKTMDAIRTAEDGVVVLKAGGVLLPGIATTGYQPACGDEAVLCLRPQRVRYGLEPQPSRTIRRLSYHPW
jgi:hypothetical protein